MSAVSDLIDTLVESGMSAADAAVLVARAHAEMVTKQPSKAAERTRRWRENKRHKPSQTVPEPSPHETVTERHKPSPVTIRDADILTTSSFPSLNLEIQKESKKESANGKTNVTVTDWPADFQEQFWRQCPRRVAKAAAMKALEKVRKSGVPWATVWGGLLRWATEAAASDPKFVKHPATWLNAGCWDDEPMPANGSKHEASGNISAAAFRLANEADAGRFSFGPRPSLVLPAPRRDNVRLLSEKRRL